jgi:hypothetical protein
VKLGTMVVVIALIVALLVVSVVAGCGKAKKQGNTVAPDPAKSPFGAPPSGGGPSSGGKSGAPPSPSAVPGGGKAGPGR